MKSRADVLLVERGFYESRARARAAIEGGLVTADGVRVGKPSELVARDAAIEAGQPHPWVSRAGLKLVAGLDAFAVDPSGRLCLDLGSSTGGFTQVLLARGASRVVAVDVGRDQLHASLRADPRVTSLEQTDARSLTADMLGGAPALVVSDVSFISLRLVLPHALSFAAPGADFVGLVKPQFEAGRAHVAKGIVRDPAIHARVCEDVRALLVDLGWEVRGLVDSPISGGDGNREFLIGARLPI